MKVIPGVLQHRLLVTDLVKKKVKKLVRKEAIERRKVWKLKESDTRARFEGRKGELVSADGVLKACDKYVGRRKAGEIKGAHSGGTRT